MRLTAAEDARLFYIHIAIDGGVVSRASQLMVPSAAVEESASRRFTLDVSITLTDRHRMGSVYGMDSGSERYR